jgi:hypothetical protein
LCLIKGISHYWERRIEYISNPFTIMTRITLSVITVIFMGSFKSNCNCSQSRIVIKAEIPCSVALFSKNVLERKL